MKTIICPRSDAIPDLTGYLPVRKAALFGVQIESGVTSCRNRVPSSASRSMFGVLIVSLPKQPKSAIPRSSTRNIRTFGGFANAKLIKKSEKNKLHQTDHIFLKWLKY